MLNVSRRAVYLLVVCLLTGCASRSTLREGEVPTSRPVSGVGQAIFDAELEAVVVPPSGWEADPLKSSDKHNHRVWLSPTGDAAYGVIYARLPKLAAFAPSRYLHNRVLNEFMAAMKADQGEAALLSKRWDGDANRMSFEAEGGLYKIDSALSVRGLSAWSVYAGTLRSKPPNEAEMALARKARDATRVGLEAASR